MGVMQVRSLQNDVVAINDDLVRKKKEKDIVRPDIRGRRSGNVSRKMEEPICGETTQRS